MREPLHDRAAFGLAERGEGPGEPGVPVGHVGLPATAAVAALVARLIAED
ncbi:hypothetical protein ACWDR2_32370 [Streptomyces sp. NPDC003631]